MLGVTVLSSAAAVATGLCATMLYGTWCAGLPSEPDASRKRRRRKAPIRAEVMSEVVNDVYRTHKMPMNKERTFTFEYDKEDDEITEGVAHWKKKQGQPISLFALSANQCNGVKMLMDTGCGHDLIGKSKAASLGVDIVQDKDEIVFQTANGTTSTSDSIKYYVNELKETVQPFVLDETPTLLSIGRRCMKMGYSFHSICGKLVFMITPEQEIVHLHVKDDIPYLVGDRIARGNRHRPVSEDILEHMKTLKEIIGIGQDDGEAEEEEKDVGDPYAPAGEEDGVEAVDFGTPGGAGPAPPRVEEPGDEARGCGPEPGEDEAEGEDDADPEAGIEVDIYEGAPIEKRIGTLKDDANTLTHVLTHRYRNPFCESCVKAKMRHFRSKSGAFQREVKMFGDLITFDLVEASGDAENSDKYVMIIRDIYTGIIIGYPIGRKNTVTVINSLKHFAGRRKRKQAYSDDAPEFIHACSELKIPHDLSRPGKKQNDSLAERTNQFIVDQTTACLAHAGLPTCYWIYATTALCHLMNVEEINGSSAWFRLHGEHLKGEKIPFGALVEFKPSDARGDKRAIRTERGNLYLCWLQPEFWSSLGTKISAWALTSFAGVDLSIRKAKIPPRLRQPHRTERIVLKIPISFPIQEKYKRRNETIEGVEEISGEDDRGVHLEQPAEDEDPDPTLLQDIDQRQLDEVEEIAGIVHDEKGEDVEVLEPGSKEDKDTVEDVTDLPHISTGKAKDCIIYRNHLGKTVKLDARGRPYPVGEDGYVDEEGKIQPNKKDGTGSSKDAAPAESTKVNAPSAKRIKAMLQERWGGDQWLYNWG